MIDISQLHQDPDSYEMIDEDGHIYIFNGTYFLDGKIPDIGTDEESLNFALPCKETLLKTMNIEEGDKLQPEINDCYIQRITNDEYEIVPIKYLPKPNPDKANYYMPGENSYGPHRRLDVFQRLIM
ncbi:hypothetical protein KP803_11735 [Vibrio sp. ZSDE26]|uniref:Uncharacterized protein n=1 Tax=Vibrio amylolyticus TaxID=2847292 RepID=A0A9X1XJJ7_9VIBR|nr:hypothetical protein [Vibrio amylolyticus]MCK6263941.1 hypothetical protein [Vibrio amylolyticus]